ncbi:MULTISPECIES: hypothetical protein [Flavobacterium]|uniref:hypothetical protein n=2 Tax=Flavobacteriaceae TaxID=49546 RepID=UPI0015B18B24|nr:MULTISPECIES: hypothetical protein [Flavobacterium]
MKTKKIINPSRFKRNTIVELNDETEKESGFYASVKRFVKAIARIFVSKQKKQQ